MWEASAEYEDGTEVCRYFSASPYKTEEEDQQDLEEWLILRHPGCIWYSVTWVEHEMEWGLT